MEHFVYLWLDRSRKMFYIGQHSGSLEDNYISSSKWLNSEVKFRPTDFKRKIIKYFNTKNEAQVYEGYLITLIKPHEFSKKYYNSKQGKPKGISPWNKGLKNVYTKEHKEAISKSRKGKPTTKGRPNPYASANGKKGALKQSMSVTGRRRLYKPDGTWSWFNPATSVTEQAGLSES